MHRVRLVRFLHPELSTRARQFHSGKSRAYTDTYRAGMVLPFVHLFCYRYRAWLPRFCSKKLNHCRIRSPSRYCGTAFRPEGRHRHTGALRAKKAERQLANRFGFTSYLVGKRRLPVRRKPSKLCATLDFSRRLRVDGQVLLAPQPKRIVSGGSATPALLGMTCQKASGFWRRLTSASDAPPKIFPSLPSARSVSDRSAVRDAACGG